jgi:lipopolysaccharide export system protein LptC
MSTPVIELNLPDLPEVPIQLGPAGVRPGESRPKVPLGTRLRDALTAYLPLLLMVALALGTWWLVKNTPQPAGARPDMAPRSDPDYTMNGFSVQRFAKDGRLMLTLEGRQLRHFPDTDRTEVDLVTIHAWAPDGRETVATARRALANGDGSELQLLGGAQVRSRTPEGTAVEIDSEFLHLFTQTERVRTHLPVVVRSGSSVLRAQGLAYDNLARRLDLTGPMRGEFDPRKATGSVRR